MFPVCTDTCSLFVFSLQPPAKFLLPEVSIEDYGKNCVVIDLDETLVHSSFKVIHLHTHTSLQTLPCTHTHTYYDVVFVCLAYVMPLRDNRITEK